MAKKKKKPLKRCKARTKNCGQCKHRYVAGDKSWECPNCQKERRCKSTVVKGFDVCRMHGAGGGPPPGTKYIIAKPLQAAFNRIYNDPTIWDMAEQQGVLGVRFEDLLIRTETIEETGGVPVEDILKLVDKVSRTMYSDKTRYQATAALQEIADKLDAEYREERLWKQIIEISETLRRNADSHKRWALQSDQLISVAEVIEVIQFLQRLAFMYIDDKFERKEYAQKLKQILPTVPK